MRLLESMVQTLQRKASELYDRIDRIATSFYILLVFFATTFPRQRTGRVEENDHKQENSIVKPETRGSDKSTQSEARNDLTWVLRFLQERCIVLRQKVLSRIGWRINESV